MRQFLLFTVSGLILWAQGQPNCTGITLDVDARCACVKDPNSQACGLVKSGFYEPHDMTKMKGLYSGYVGTVAPPAARTAPAQPARPRQARVVALPSREYLRFLQPDAQLALGFDFEKMFQSPELMGIVFGAADGEDGRQKMMGALKEMDHLWMSVAGPSDVVLLMTGRFEQGVAAGMFYAQGIQPVFLGNARVMMIGSEPSIQAALARLARPPAATAGWVARRARELSKDHEAWIVTEPPADAKRAATAFSSVRKFAMGVRVSGVAGIDGEVVADSDANAAKIAEWVDHMKAMIREKTGAGALDALTVERSGETLRFAAKDDGLLNGEAGKSAMNSDFGVELYDVFMSGFPGVPARTVAADKLVAVKAGMKREEVLTALGPPLSITSIQGLETPRETWTYQVPFGKQYTLRLDGGVVSSPPR